MISAPKPLFSRILLNILSVSFFPFVLKQVCITKKILVLLSFLCVTMEKLGPAYSGSSVGGQDGASQLSMASRHSSILGGGGPNEADVSGGYRAHTSAAAHYGGQYSSVYGSAALSSSQQVSSFYPLLSAYFC